ncbi:MAG TPA: DNA-3-methyladenine glycosylase [Acidimicrobiales bacterium]
MLPRSFYDRPSHEVAPALLHKVLVVGDRAVRIVEVEAYAGGDDPASHAYRGRTARNATMFGPPGHLYVYFTYGMHWCANAVCGPAGSSSAVLVRAGAPLVGMEAMFAVRPAARRERDLCSGPAKLCEALGVDRAFDGADLAHPGHVGHHRSVTILDDGTPPPRRPGRSPRIGIRVAVDVPWRWFVAGDPNVSRAR